MPQEDAATWIFQDWNTGAYDLTTGVDITQYELAPYEVAGPGVLVAAMFLATADITTAAGARFSIYRHTRSEGNQSLGTKIGESAVIPTTPSSGYNAGPVTLPLRPVAGQSLTFQHGDALRMIAGSVTGVPTVASGSAETRMIAIMQTANRRRVPFRKDDPT